MLNFIFLALSVLAFLAAIAATVLIFVFVLPEKRKDRLPAFFRVLRDFFNFSYLVIEKALQALYIFSTFFVILYGFFSIFNIQITKVPVSTDIWTGKTYYTNQIQWDGWKGLILMILGPIILRLTYELMMLIILLVKNVIQINKKLKNQNEGGVEDALFSIPKLTVKKNEPAAQSEEATAPAEETETPVS